MNKIIQSKFEVREPLPAPRDHQWASDKSARRPGVKSGNTAFFNDLPPGSNMSAQETFTDHPMPNSLAGESDVSNNVNPSTLRKGYGRLKMLPTDDMSTPSDHVDVFYDEITVDGSTGFAERGNVLDRL